eukprot:PITA_35375
MYGGGVRCGACKFLRRKCVKGCVFAPYFGYDEGAAHFAEVHKIFGANNVSKLLLHIPTPQRWEAAATISYEAQARVQDPVYGCVAHIYALQQQVASLQAELATVHAQLASRMSSGSASTSANFRTMPSASYSQHPHQLPAHLSLPCEPIPQPYSALLSCVRKEKPCDLDCEFPGSTSDDSSRHLEIFQRRRNQEENEEDSGELQDLVHTLIRRG